MLRVSEYAVADASNRMTFSDIYCHQQQPLPLLAAKGKPSGAAAEAARPER